MLPQDIDPAAPGGRRHHPKWVTMGTRVAGSERSRSASTSARRPWRRSPSRTFDELTENDPAGRIDEGQVENACGKFPRWRPVSVSNSSA